MIGNRSLTGALLVATLFTGAARAESLDAFSSGVVGPDILIEEHILGEALLDLPANADIRVSFIGTPPDGVTSIDAFNIDARSGNFAGRFYLEDGTTSVLQGQVQATIPVLLPQRRISAGEIISQADVSSADMPVHAVTSYVLRDARDILGKQVKRTLMPGRPIAEHSLMEPLVVQRGDNVTISYKSGSLDLTAPGRALEDAARGENVRIVNLHSSKTIFAQATRDGMVTVQPAQNYSTSENQ